MKKIIILICALLFLTNIYAQKQIKGTSTYFPQEDFVSISITELNYLISRSYVICSKIDTLDDGSMIKTIELQSHDTTFRFVGAYVESNAFFPNDIKFSIEQKPTRLTCAFAIVDNGELYESYELDSLGRKYFERLLNKAPLVCVDPNKGTMFY